MNSFCSDIPECGQRAETVRLNRLLFAALALAVADIRRVHEANHRSGDVCAATQQNKFAPWQRGQMAGSAAFILDYADGWSIPRTVVTLSKKILEVEQAFLEELYAASAAGMPWKKELAAHCLSCGRIASWREAVTAQPLVPIESAWRYQRPENCVPLCFRCAARLGWNKNLALRIALVWSLWGLRFEAFWQWHYIFMECQLPLAWDRQADPLWPPEFCGATWETGSGAIQYSVPMPPHGIVRTPQQRAIIEQVLPFRSPVRDSGLADIHLVPVSGQMPVAWKKTLPGLDTIAHRNLLPALAVKTGDFWAAA